jgi:hypothetical protein
MCEDGCGAPQKGHFHTQVKLGREAIHFLLVYRASIHEFTGTTLARMVFVRELRLACDLLFGASPGKELSTTGCVADLAERLHCIHHYTRRRLEAASDRIKAGYDRLANST